MFYLVRIISCSNYRDVDIKVCTPPQMIMIHFCSNQTYEETSPRDVSFSHPKHTYVSIILNSS